MEFYLFDKYWGTNVTSVVTICKKSRQFSLESSEK